MNTRLPINDSAGPAALSVSFNNDHSCFAVALETGFKVFKTESCELSRTRDFGAGIGTVQILERSGYTALVGGGRSPQFPQNKVVIWDDQTARQYMSMEYASAVQRVCLSRTHVVVVLLNSVLFYKHKRPPQKLGEFSTANNPFGLCVLGKHHCAFPGRTPGHVQVVELAHNNVSIIPAHGSPLHAMAISPDGMYLATASETGTLIRVWATANCARIAEFRRGVDPATIFSLGISPSSTFLAVTSDKSTLHIFDLPQLDEPPPSSSPATSRRGATSPDFAPAASEPPARADQGPSPQPSKWGILSALPLLPRLFSDTYSSLSAPFSIGDEATPGHARRPMAWNVPLPGVPGGVPPKGLVGWLSDSRLVVLGAGQDARWERFVVGVGEDGRRGCVREGWRRYLED